MTSLKIVLQDLIATPCSAPDFFRALFDALRPDDWRDGATAAARWRELNGLIVSDEECRRFVGEKVLDLLTTTRTTTFFTDTGILPNAGFFSELWRKAAHKLLPEVRDPAVLRDCIDIIFHGAGDAYWLDAVPWEEKVAFWRNLDIWHAGNRETLERMVERIGEAMLILSHRTVALGLDPELERITPDVGLYTSPFPAMHYELRSFLDSYRESLIDALAEPKDERHLAVLFDQCRAVLQRAYRGARNRGANLRLVYLLKRLEQHLDRLELLLSILGVRFAEEKKEEAVTRWALFLREAVKGEKERNSIARHISELTGLLALRVTENAGRTGEHYITTDWDGYRGMWRSAMGAGFIIAFLSLIKILASGLSLAPMGYATVYSLDYGLGFVLVAMLHLTIATKQPAMTASKIAAEISGTRSRLREMERLADLVVNTVRSQVAAILGNVTLAMATAAAVAGLALWAGGAFLTAEKGTHLIHDLSPFRSLAVFHAAIAGVYLFASGLISGYFDNLATYAQIGRRVTALGWLRALAGEKGAAAVGGYVDRNLGLIAGNFFFGCMLGTTSTIGLMTGLPLDIRHIAFSSANMIYGMAALSYDMAFPVLIESLLGVAVIGAVNLSVSFVLALWVAMRSHGVGLRAALPVLGVLAKRLRRNPRPFILPPPERSVPGSQGG
jgi:site-specific recombinase